MSADVFQELLTRFRSAEAEWPVKWRGQFKIWARPFLHNGRPELGWSPRNNKEWHLASFRVDSREWGYHIFTHSVFPDDDKPVERFTELATKAGALLSLDFQSRISPKPNGPINWWLALMWRLYPADDTEYGDKPRIFLDNPFFDSANAIEHCQLHTDEPMWPGPVWPRDSNSPKAQPANYPMDIAIVGADITSTQTEAGGNGKNKEDPPKATTDVTFTKRSNLFRHWHSSDNLKAAEILDKWNSLSNEERRILVPSDSQKIPAKKGKQRKGAVDNVRNQIKYKLTRIAN